MNLRTVAYLTVALALTGASAGELRDLEKVSPWARAVTATQGELAIAVVFPSESTAKLVIRVGEAPDESREFKFPRAANYGAPWVEHIVIKSHSSFVVHIRTRQPCGPGRHDFTFAHRGGEWLIAGLDREEHACSDEGPVLAWRKSYNFLIGRTERADYVRGHRGRAIVERRQFPLFKLIEFDPLNSRYER
jgi:hypothetical protein